MLHIPSLYIMTSEGRGRGIFTSETIEAESIIELCPLVIIPKEQVGLIHQTILHDYYFLTPDNTGDACILLGYGLLYNHHNAPNAEVLFDLPNNVVQIHCIQPISAGQEIFINYQNAENNKEKLKLWFDEI